MTRILVFLLAILVLPACSTLPERVAQSPYPQDYWHSYIDWSRGFSVDAPGQFAIRPATDTAFKPLAPRAYTLNRGTLRFSIVAVEIDRRSDPAIVAHEAYDLDSWDYVGGKDVAYQRHVYLEGRMYRQRLVFARGMIYELLVSGPADVFPDFAARRFLDSFIVMVKT
jgi:hypothetical protein